MKVTVADHGDALGGTTVDERSNCRGEIGAVECRGGNLEMLQETVDAPDHRRRHRVDRGADRFGIERVERRHRTGELRREAVEQCRRAA